VYENGIEEFLEFAQRNVKVVNERYFCPCVNYLNEKQLEIKFIQEHVICDAFLKSYVTWI